jgi:hypothetical protein
MITDIDGCSGRGVSVDMTNSPDVAQLRNIKPESPPMERRHQDSGNTKSQHQKRTGAERRVFEVFTLQIGL